MTRTAIPIAVLLGCAPVLFAQTDLPPIPTPSTGSLPPLNIPTNTVVELPNGMAVSQPLQPVMIESIPQAVTVQPPPPRVIEQAVEPTPTRPFAKSWHSMELLNWWTKPANLPPLVTTNSTQSPVLSNPYTTLLFGGGRGDAPSAAGGRFKMGWAVGGNNSAGFEIGYQFLGTHSNTDTFRNGGSAYEPFLGIPLRNAITGLEDAVLIGGPGQTARLDITQTSRVQGWELTGLGNLYNADWVKVHALAGYRYFMLNEGVRLDLRSSLAGRVATTAPGVPATDVLLRSAIADQFDAHNRFHGAQLGLRTEFERRGFFAELDTKVSFGRTVEVVKVSGQTVAVVDVPGNPGAVSYFPSGLFGQPTNTGRVSRSAFAVLPEAVVKLGFRFGERSRCFVGYNFLYLSSAVRAGEQFDRTVDLTQSQPIDPAALRLASTRPYQPFDRSDLWVQGLTFGLEWRY